ncbi:MAG TPA: nuclear transport factor 2 family protein [Polyangiaceae bacterium]|nr:nuclear transport factor 2 family protein [Polyangiaceae bacterium]
MSLDRNREVLAHLYGSFQRRDAQGMIDCYAEDAVFEDPVFGQLDHELLTRMWRMFCERGQDLEVSFVVSPTENGGTVEWDARYTFRKTGRKVHNRIASLFEVRDGKIVKQKDSFSLWRWSRMALGATGILFGWAPPVQRAIRSAAQKDLRSYSSSVSN